MPHLACGEVTSIYASGSLDCVVHRLDIGWVLEVQLTGRISLSEIALIGQIMRDFMGNSAGRECFALFDMRTCELITIQQAQAFAQEMQEMRAEIERKIVASAVCMSSMSAVSKVVSQFLKSLYKPARPLHIHEGETVRRGEVDGFFRAVHSGS